MANAAHRKQQEAEWQALCARIQAATSSLANTSSVDREKRVAKTRKDYAAFVAEFMTASV